MTDNPRAVIGGNLPPDPIDEATAPFDAILSEAQNWADGQPVENEAQMKAVDALIKEVKRASKEVGAARDASTKPLHEAWKAEVARWKPTLDDLDRIVKCLVAAVDPFKRKLAEEKAAKERAAWEAANKARREAEEAAARANAADLDAQRSLEAARQAAIDAENAAKAQAKDGVKGMRTVTLYEVTDHRDLLNWIARNRRDDLTAFIDEWARKNHNPNPGAAGLRVWTEKRAY